MYTFFETGYIVQMLIITRAIAYIYIEKKCKCAAL